MNKGRFFELAARDRAQSQRQATEQRIERDRSSRQRTVATLAWLGREFPQHVTEHGPHFRLVAAVDLLRLAGADVTFESVAERAAL